MIAEPKRLDVGIEHARIAAFGRNLGETAENTIDARGLLVLPGCIDGHVHLAQPSEPAIVMADDFASGTRAAAFGGNTMVLPFAYSRSSSRCATVCWPAKKD